MAERDEVGGSFGGLDACDAGDDQRVAFGIGAERRQDVRTHAHEGVGARGAFGGTFGADIDHAGLAGIIEMR